MRALQVDVTDGSALRAAMADADVVLNTVGPYYRFGLTVLRAAIATGTHYLDICDDWEPTLRMLDLDEEARAAGVCAVVGMGASPGVSNLLAARAVQQLDHVQDLYTAWPVDVSGNDQDDEQLLDPDGQPSAAAVHWMEQISGKVAVVSDGQLVHRRPLRPVTLTLSPSTPERRTPSAIPSRSPSTAASARPARPPTSWSSPQAHWPTWTFYAGTSTAGKLTNETAAIDLAKPSVSRSLRAVAGAMGLKGPRSLPPFFAAAMGTRKGRPVTVLSRLAETSGMTALIDDMAEATGIPLALGLAQLLDGTGGKPGVHPPEAVIEPERFFLDLSHHLPHTSNNDQPGNCVITTVTPSH